MAPPGGLIAKITRTSSQMVNTKAAPQRHVRRTRSVMEIRWSICENPSQTRIAKAIMPKTINKSVCAGKSTVIVASTYIEHFD